MSGLQFHAYKGWGDRGRALLHYSQAVRVGDRIECSGQGEYTTHLPPSSRPVSQKLTFPTGGWDTNKTEGGPSFPSDLNEEIDQAFENVELNLRDAGGKGWSQVFRVNTYHRDIKASHARVVENYRKYMPNHRPIWTEIGVKELGAPQMNIEIEVVAYDPEGAEAARKA